MRRRVLVTGANSGIGLATALEAARRGFDSVGSSRTQEGAAVIREEAARAGVSVEALVLDLSDPESLSQSVADLDLWAVVNNAGFTNAGAFEDVPVAEARRQLEVMVVSPIAVALAALPSMRRRGSGRVVNVLSMSVGSGVPLLGWYQAAKHALAGATDALRNEFASSGVEVIAIDPGMVDTPIWNKTYSNLAGRYRGSWLRPSYEQAMGLIETLRPMMRSPQAVADAVGRALTDGDPPANYPVGLDAYALNAVLRFVPRKTADFLVRRILGA